MSFFSSYSCFSLLDVFQYKSFSNGDAQNWTAYSYWGPNNANWNELSHFIQMLRLMHPRTTFPFSGRASRGFVGSVCLLKLCSLCLDELTPAPRFWLVFFVTLHSVLANFSQFLVLDWVNFLLLILDLIISLVSWALLEKRILIFIESATLFTSMFLTILKNFLSMLSSTLAKRLVHLYS